MANGQTAHFVIQRSHLAKLVDGMAPTTVIGSRGSRPVTAAELLETLADPQLPFDRGLEPDDVYVSQQDCSWYIVMLGGVETAIDVDETSPLLEPLDRYREEVWPRVVIERTGVFTRKDGGPLFDLEPARPAHPDERGWLTCPHCGVGFAMEDWKQWSGEKHLYCRGRIRVVDGGRSM